MPEKMTKEESRVQRAIDAARVAKQMLEATGSAFEYCPDIEEVKVKRPKAEKDNTKPKKTEGTHSGYGSAGDEDEYKIKKARKLSMEMPEDAAWFITQVLEDYTGRKDEGYFDSGAKNAEINEELSNFIGDYFEKKYFPLDFTLNSELRAGLDKIMETYKNR